MMMEFVRWWLMIHEWEENRAKGKKKESERMEMEAVNLWLKEKMKVIF